MAKVSLMFDTKSINSDIPIGDVIKAYAGIPLSPSGEAGKTNIHCPSPEHQDSKPSARIYKASNKCKCFSCNEAFSPISLAKQYYPELKFYELCQKLVDDFGLNIYDYSNMREVEESLNAAREKRFYDSFPLTNEELDFIGLPNHPHIEPDKDKTFSGHFMKQHEYWNTFDPNIYDFYSAEELANEMYDDEGNELEVELTYEEAAYLGLEDPHYFEMIEEMNATMPTMRDMWKEDKLETEKMLIDFAGRTVEALEKRKEECIQRCDAFEAYCLTKEGMIAAKTFDTWEKFKLNDKPIKITPKQEETIIAYARGRDELNSKEIVIQSCDEKIARAKEIAEKVRSHQKERKAAERKAWKIER